MFTTQDYNVFLHTMNKRYSINIEDIDAFFKIGVLQLFFNFPDSYKKYFYEKETETFIIPEKISLIHEFNILNYFIKFCISNQLTITVQSYSLLAQSKLGYFLFFSTGTSYDNEYGDILFLIKFNNNHFTKHDINLLNPDELNQYNQYLYFYANNLSFKISDFQSFISFMFKVPFKLDYNDLEYDKINKHIQSMFKEYNKLRKTITPTTEHFFERALLEKNIENF